MTDVIVTTLYEHHQNPVTYKASISTPDYDGDGLLDYLDPLPQVPIANLAGNLAQVNGDVTQFTLEAGYYDPVVILGLPTSVHSGEGVARVSDVSAEGFVLRFQEWDYLDGVHGVEEIPYLVASKGHYHTADGAVIEVYKGTLEAGQAAQWVEFAEPFTAPPMVFPTLQTMNAPTAAALRIGEVTQEGFWVTVTEQESRREETRVAEVLGYVAILDEDGEGSLIINGEEVPYSLQRHQIPPTGLIVNGVGVVMEEEQSLDDETMHLPEWAGFWRLGGDLFAQVDSNLEADTLGLRITADTSGFVPFVGAGADTSGTEGASVSFEGSFIPSNTDAEYTIEWDFGDETVASGSLTVAHVFHQPGEFLVTLTVTGSDGAYASDTLTATIANALLTADAGENQNVAEGEVVSFVAGVTDEGGEDTYGYQWAFGDGNEAQGQSVTHAYADNGVYQVTLTVTDGEGGVANDNQTVTVANVDPVAEAGANQSVKEGDTVSFTGSATDAGSADTFSYVWDFGDGSSATAGKSASHVYADNGVYTVTLSVTDDDEGVGTDTQTVSVANVAPVVAVDPAELFAGSSTIGFSGAFNDAGSADTHNFEWDFGDGVINIGSLETSHIFGASGLFDVTLTVTDDDGGEDSAWVSVRTWTLDVSAGNGGSVTSAMSGIDCETDCTESYPEGTAVALTATPEIGYLFDGWGGACNGDGACSVTLNGDLSVTASFIPDDLPCSTEPEVLTATDYDSINSEVSIESDGFVELLETDAVEYRAPVIRFLPDFRAPYGSELRAKAVTVSCQ